MTDPAAAGDPADHDPSANLDSSSEAGGAAMAALIQRVSTLEAELATARDQALRAMAEAENTRRRLGREMDDQRQFAIANFARDLLRVPDNLRRALDAAPPELRADDRFRSFAEGVELTERELLAVLERHGISAVAAAGQAFDHNLHQAVVQIETTDQAPGTIVQVFQTGYAIRGRLLRPAMVAVAKAPAQATEPEPDGSDPA